MARAASTEDVRATSAARPSLPAQTLPCVPPNRALDGACLTLPVHRHTVAPMPYSTCAAARLLLLPVALAPSPSNIAVHAKFNGWGGLGSEVRLGW